ncbi:ABC transporter ATP-binding protein [Ectobacillus funiculus]|uniref:Putative hemin import ATP-binding protein HrtA n=1 Tax=Ectobacillus funiculus TaxID=137993 RepID=A0ABV5WHH4_9BACI
MRKLVLENISKVYGEGDGKVTALDRVSLEVQAGEFIGVVGPSGSGKSTFLSVAGALLSPSSGTILLNGQDITKLSSKELTKVRLKQIGFVFQSSNLVPYLNVRDQLLFVSRLAGSIEKEAEQRAQELLSSLDMVSRQFNYPNQLSGGQRQRVAIARAFMNNPQLILADEPTASLDSKHGRAVAEMLAREVRERGKAAIMVTHDDRVLDLCDRIVTIRDGKLYE